MEKPLPVLSQMSLEEVKRMCPDGRGGWTVAIIKELLRGAGISVSGNKETLCQRLIEHHEKSQTPKPQVIQPPKPQVIQPPKPQVIQPPKLPAIQPPKPPVIQPPKLHKTQPHKVIQKPEKSPSLAKIVEIDNILTKYLETRHLRNKLVCHAYAEGLVKSSAPLAMCLPVRIILKYLESLKVGIDDLQLTPIQYEIFRRYFDWMSLHLKQHRKLQEIEVVEFNETQLRAFVMQTLPLIYRLTLILNSSPKGQRLLSLLLNQGERLDNQPQVIWGHWPIGVMIRVVNSMLNEGHIFPPEFITQFQTLVDLSLLP